ncbi:MAG: acetate--CoA ligase family protein [Candidatus Rokubacteria bacterium]|nr:acetate--CoA ligase family protein [Candidatus Rokubacteria bacterium]
MALLTPFFHPRGVAVIGASRDPSKIGGSVLANLRAAGFPGRIVPVNARADTVQGLPAVPSLLAAEAAVDLAVVAVPARDVLAALKECAAKGVGGAVVISAGFREAGAEGRAREAELRAWLRGQSIRVLGPNCLGWIRPSARLNLTFAPGMPPAGGIAFVSHSGALATAILDWARDRRLGFSLFASLGNQVDLNESDVLEAVAADPETRVIVGYVEGVADGRRFFETLRAAAAVKPVILLKAGRSAEGARAVSSHTGALAGSDQAFDAAVRQAGAVRVRTVEELFDLARGLASQPLPRGRRLLVVTNGGGLGIVATDAAREAGLEVAPLDEPTRARLRAVLPPTASVVNPVDLVGDADAARYGNALDVAGPCADAALVILTAQAATDALGVARAVLGATRGWSIPVAAAFVGGARVAPGVRALEEGGVPCYPFPEPAVGTLAGMALVAERRRRPAAATGPPPPPPESAVRHVAALRAAGAGRLGWLELAPLLGAYGIPVAPAELAPTAEAAGAAAGRLGCPVALKIVSPDVTHKSDVGGVRLGVGSPREAAETARAMLAAVRRARPQATIEGVLVQAMAPAGKELLLGVVRDPQFGPLVVVGFGGIYVEVLKDTAARLAPVSPEEASLMLDELRMAPVLRGARGEPPVDRAALADAMARFARLALDFPELAEIELNPVIAGAAGVMAVDARATLRAPGGADEETEEPRRG